ncbi:hypothetical protein C0995_015727 [Termitomyces sp. Mi166|nr:hypothetical protein C0995_015727 [Termitomyces sp. Mi166\
MSEAPEIVLTTYRIVYMTASDAIPDLAWKHLVLQTLPLSKVGSVLLRGHSKTTILQMPEINCSIYVTIENNTNRILKRGIAQTDHRDSGEWIGFPPFIEAQRKVEFTLRENAWFTGTAGAFAYDVGITRQEKFSAYIMDGYTKRNSISVDLPSPSLCILTFSGKVDNKNWYPSSVPPSGHPVYVSFTLDYNPDVECRFEMVEISAYSDHPVRNSSNKLITANHILWSPTVPSRYIDKNRGSSEPNIFSHNFKRRIDQNSILSVKVKTLDIELVGTHVALYGKSRLGANRIIESGKFTFKNIDVPTTVLARVTSPTKSEKPFSLNDDITWSLEVLERSKLATCIGEKTTRLELYWIATSLHPAFKAYIPVNFLRNILPAKDKTNASDEFYQVVTKKVFSDYNKCYDTIAGVIHLVSQVEDTDNRFSLWQPDASWFNLDASGGRFHLTFYLAQDATSKLRGPGTLSRYVNCMDQTAMLELSCSLYGGSQQTSWLYQNPFGYIKTTNLVGIKNKDNVLIDVNNPYFGTNPNFANLKTDNLIRHPVKFHVYAGRTKSWDREKDGIYDGCIGPHVGTETIDKYLANALDTETTLYKNERKARECKRPGTIDDTSAKTGVTGIDGAEVLPRSYTIPPLEEPLSRLVDTTMSNTVGPLAHVGWAHLPIWLNGTLGDAWNVRFEQVSVNETGTQGLWLISNDNTSDSHIHVHVNVVSVIGQDGQFDMEGSTAVVKEEIGSVLMSTARQDVWMSSTLPGLGGVCLRYADHIAAGRIVLVAGNIVMDIRGMTSYEALLPYALKLFNRTLCSDLELLNDSPPVIPVLQRQAIRMGTNTSDSTTFGGPELKAGIIRVNGIGTRFSVIFSVSCKIATVNAGSEEHGVLFDHPIIEELDNGKGCTVECLFIANEIGRHHVRVCMADLETMIGAMSDMEVEVFDTPGKGE